VDAPYTHVGVDIGQRQDYTAICVAEIQERPVGPTELVQAVSARGNYVVLDRPARTQEHHVVRHLERLPLGTDFTDVADHIVRLCSEVAAYSIRKPTLLMDATGAVPFFDQVRALRPQATLVPCFFNHGDRCSREGGEMRVGKAWIVNRLQVSLQNRTIHLPRTPAAELLAQELLDFEIRVDPRGSDTYGAFRVGTHDDLVTALGLATLPRAPSSVLVVF